MKKFAKTALAAAIALCISGAAAEEQHLITYNGKPVFNLVFANDEAEEVWIMKAWSLTSEEKQGIIDAATYWASIFGQYSNNTSALNIRIFLQNVFLSDDNASFGTYTESEEELLELLLNGGYYDTLQKALINGDYDGVSYVGQYSINQSKNRGVMTTPYPIPTTGNMDLYAVTLHELTHGLGIGTEAVVGTQTYKSFKDFVSAGYYGMTYEDGNYVDFNTFAVKYGEAYQDQVYLFISSESSAYITHLYSYWAYDEESKTWFLDWDNPTATAPGMTVTCLDTDYNTDLFSSVTAPVDCSAMAAYEAGDTTFIVGNYVASGVFFVGEHVSEVLNGAMVGIPIDGREGSSINLSHFELAHSSMSHQSYRNYVTLMEAELAAFQDLGYDIDRRNYYGYSEYRDGQSYTNENVYYARNSEGTAYLDETSNTATLGVGFHIYGSNNTITQAGNLYADGNAGTGIRNDGSNNDITVAEGTKVTANGLNGSGILMAYGKNNTLTVNGTVEATGSGGKAINLDFGKNMIGDSYGVRGSYIFQVKEKDKALVDENGDSVYYEGYAVNLDGPLVSELNINGTVSGETAIYISDNAYVETVNINTGAQISGDIVSNWDPTADYVQSNGLSLYTAVNFGDSADFNLAYTGNISGKASLELNFNQGTTSLYGNVDVYSISLASDSTLYLNQVLAGDDYSFTTTSFNAKSGSKLVTPLTEDGNISSITVSDAENAVTDFTWTVTITPTSYKADGETLAINNLPVVNENGKKAGDYSLSGVADFSNTLKAKASGDNAIVFYREDDAYSSLAENATQKGAGSALDSIAGKAQGDMQNIVYALDSADIGEYRRGLQSLSGELYDYADYGQLRDYAKINGTIMRHNLGRINRSGALRKATAAVLNETELNYVKADKDGLVKTTDYDFYLMPFGDRTLLNGRGGTADLKVTSGGLIAGVDITSDEGYMFGFNLGFIGRHNSMSDGYSGRINSAGGFVGVYGLLSYPEWDGAYLSIQTRLGIEENHSKRRISFNGYNAQLKGEYSSYNAGLMLGAGKDFSFGTTQLGPLATLEYNVSYRDSFIESGSGAALEVDSNTADSFQATLGGHISQTLKMQDNLNMILDLMGGYKHEFIDGEYQTRSAFNGYNSYSFSSETDVADTDSGVLQGTVIFMNDARDIDVRFTLGYEYGDAARTLNFGMASKWVF